MLRVGQYFLIVNLDKKEYINPRGTKMWELLANHDGTILAYLLFTDNLDGTTLIRSDVLGFNDEEARKEWGEYEKIEVRGYGSKTTLYTPKTRYLGRWCGDRIAIVGDYADLAGNYDGPQWSKIIGQFTDITNEVLEEFSRVFPDIAERMGLRRIRPDMVVHGGS